MLKLVIGSVLLILVVLIIKGINDYSRNRHKLEELDQAKEDSESLDIEEEIAIEKRHQRVKRSDIDDINSDR